MHHTHGAIPLQSTLHSENTPRDTEIDCESHQGKNAAYDHWYNWPRFVSLFPKTTEYSPRGGLENQTRNHLGAPDDMYAYVCVYGGDMSCIPPPPHTARVLHTTQHTSSLLTTDGSPTSPSRKVSRYLLLREVARWLSVCRGECMRMTDHYHIYTRRTSTLTFIRFPISHLHRDSHLFAARSQRAARCSWRL
jgi:hypothetical protein